MGQPGLFDQSDRLNGLSRLGDNFVALNAVVGWEVFRPAIKQVFAKERRGNAGRKAYGVVLMFKVLAIRALYNLGDDRVECQVRDRLMYLRFLGLADAVADAKTVRLFRNHLAERGVVEGLFAAFDKTRREAGYLAQGGEIVDASIVPLSKQRNSREETVAGERSPHLGGALRWSG